MRKEDCEGIELSGKYSMLGSSTARGDRHSTILKVDCETLRKLTERSDPDPFQYALELTESEEFKKRIKPIIDKDVKDCFPNINKEKLLYWENDLASHWADGYASYIEHLQESNECGL